MNNRSKSDETSSGGTEAKTATNHASRPRFEFPFKLHTILEDAAREGHEWIISWLPNGKAFKVHSRKDFEAHILPRYFSAPKYRSFQRQLAMYGFKLVRDRNSEDFRAYHNKLFVRGVPDLCKEMMRHVNQSPTRRRRRNKTKTAPLMQGSAGFGLVPGKSFESRGITPVVTTSEGTSAESGASHVLFSPVAPFHEKPESQNAFLDQPQVLPRPPCLSLQEEMDLLQFSIDANNYLDASSRTETSAPPQQQGGAVDLAATPRIPGTITCSNSETSNMSSCSAHTSAPRAVPVPSGYTSGHSAAHTKIAHDPGGGRNDLLYQSNFKDDPSLGAFFGDGCSLHKPEDPRTAAVNANMLAKIGESLMAQDQRQNWQAEHSFNENQYSCAI